MLEVDYNYDRLSKLFEKPEIKDAVVVDQNPLDLTPVIVEVAGTKYEVRNDGWRKVK